MDPKATLSALQDVITADTLWLRAGNTDHNPDFHDEWNELRDAYNEWVRKGGFKVNAHHPATDEPVIVWKVVEFGYISCTKVDGQTAYRIPVENISLETGDDNAN